MTNPNDREEREQSSSDGSIRRRPFLGTVGAFGLGAGLAGRVGADEDGWPSPDDHYYAELVGDLSQLDIPPGEFVCAENEADTFATYELAGEHEDLAARESLDVSDDDVTFVEATRISVGELEDGSLDPWGVTVQATVEDQAVSAGDTLLGVAYVRNPGTGGSTADVTYKSTEADNEAENYVLNGGIAAGQEWERYFFPIDFQTAGDAGEWWTEFWVGIEGQTVDIGGLALLNFAQDVDANELPSWDDEIDLEDGWEEEADARIQEHRTANLTVSVTDADGDAVDAAVDLEMQDHEFAFGTAVDANRLQTDDADGEQYRGLIPELFNTTVLENHHKWRFFEDNQELADDATDWILEQDLDIRGHACLWSSRDSNSIPEDVEDAMDEGDADYVAERSLEHIETVIEHYGDDMEHWDVVNEAVHETEMTEVIDGEDVDPVEAPILEEWYETATEVAPESVALDVNDYNVLSGPYEGTRDDYERQIEFLAGAAGVDLGGIGLQSHFSRGEQLTPGEIMDVLDRYAEAGDGAPLRITEFDMADPNWLEADKADFFHWFLKTIYSHPEMEDFLMWGFWDDEHWQDDAPLFDEEWNPKPTYDVYTDLVFEEWWTDETGETNADGAFNATAFLGEYDLTIDAGDGEFSTSLSLEEPTDESVEITLVEIDVRGSGRGNGRVPVHVHGGDAFDPADVDYDTVRFGDPDVVAGGGGSDVVHLPGGPGDGTGRGNGRGNCSQMVHFDGADSELEDVAMITGRTADGDIIVGFDRL
ncbi:endo-1,4-beta-xylanase [Natronorubrum texcoconense]|uniref:endo-1,4-beta-xylanase n=1 Tax=Natronorubrum texcoconense TaxID=1095776 RepID=A0A1G9CT64_9EURY|nr:endo-1,4-beta-xylanase [Natronorubrum texcoconense]SDK54819.1 Endo-1,4-beta-xylanase, GH35 family [Natronorubrum texcoconense]